jgi:hypothetical protein
VVVLQGKVNHCECPALRRLLQLANEAVDRLKREREKSHRRSGRSASPPPPTQRMPVYAAAQLPLPAPAWSQVRLLDAFTLDNDLANSTRHGLWRRVVAAYEDMEDETDEFLACYPRLQDGVRVCTCKLVAVVALAADARAFSSGAL